jgi:hypothetical protein
MQGCVTSKGKEVLVSKSSSVAMILADSPVYMLLSPNNYCE